MRRRDLLTAGAATAGGLLLPRRASAAWGDAPATAADLLLPPGIRAERSLDLFLYGGMTTFEAFYVVPEYGTPDDPDPALRNTQWHLFADKHADVFGSCDFGASDGWLTPFGTDALGMTVNLGPIVSAFKARPDILARMRIIVTRHDFAPHELAIPNALTGLRLGNPRLAGTGAHVQRYWLEQDTTGRLVPWSWVLSPYNDIPLYNVATASDVGLHPGSARPLQLAMSGDMDLAALLGRQEVGADATRLDPWLLYFADRQLSRYVDPRTGAPLRSRTLTDHQFALEELVNAPNLQKVLDPALFVPPPGSACALDEDVDVGAMTLSAAVGLLTQADTPAKHVTVVDGGFQFYSSLQYDSHFTHLDNQSKNVSHALTQLANHINRDGENDATKLDLDDTLIWVGSEFGRTPYLQSNDGTNHHPYGYVNILIGGPVIPGITGAIGPDGYATTWMTPAEIRAGILAGLGIYPFSPESFAVGDLQGVADERDGLVRLHQQILGRST